MKNILFVTSSDPRLSQEGHSQRTNLLWESLKGSGRVYTIVYDETYIGEPMAIEGEHPIFIFNSGMRKYTKKIKYFPHRISSYLTRIIYLPTALPSEYTINEIYKNTKFDLVVSRYVQIPARYHLWNIAPLIIDFDDHPLQVFDTMHKYNRPVILRPLAKFLLKQQLNKLIDKIEIGWLSNQFLITESSAKLVYLPNIPYHISEFYNPKCTERKYLFTIGLMSYEPNYKGVDAFLSNIWPIFHEKYPDIEYLIGGKGAPLKYVQKWERVDGVKYVGYVEDLAEAYKHCIAAIVPIYSGSGTCIKTLEAMAYSRVCISTPFGARGFKEAQMSGKNGLLIFNNAREFINAYETIISTKKREDLEKRAKDFIDNNYSYKTFKSIVNRTLDTYFGDGK